MKERLALGHVGRPKVGHSMLGKVTLCWILKSNVPRRLGSEICQAQSKTVKRDVPEVPNSKGPSSTSNKIFL